LEFHFELSSIPNGPWTIHQGHSKFADPGKLYRIPEPTF